MLFLSDFETGMIAAAQDEFPDGTHHGCYFHLTQVVWHKVQTLGLTVNYEGDATISISCFDSSHILSNRCPSTDVEHSKIFNLRTNNNCKVDITNLIAL